MTDSSHDHKQDAIQNLVSDLAAVNALVAKAHRALACTYISMTGTAGNDGSAEAVKTVTLPAGILTQVGDRLRVRVYWRGDTGSPITASVTVNGIEVSAHPDAGAASQFVCEAWLHYGDASHANILETGTAPATGTHSLNNVAGFDWTSDQSITVSQDNVANNHIVVYAIIVDLLPKA